MTNKERFIELYKTNIKRPGSEKLLEYLLSPHSDFFEAPASARFHGSYDGGLLEHSLNVYDCLKDYLQRERVKDTYQMKQLRLFHYYMIYVKLIVIKREHVMLKKMVNGFKYQTMNMMINCLMVMVKKVFI